MDFDLKTTKTTSDPKKSEGKWYLNITTQVLLAIIAGLILLVALLLFIILIVSVKENEAFDASPEEIIASARILEKMDLTSDPCEDFYQYTCGNYKDKAMVDLDKFLFNPTFDDEDVLSIFPRLFSKIIGDPESSCAIELELAEYYYSCMDEDYTKDEKTDDIHFMKMNTSDVETMEYMDNLFKHKFYFTIGSPNLEAANWSTLSGKRPLFQWFSDPRTIIYGHTTAKSLYFEAWYEDDEIKVDAPHSSTVNLTLPLNSNGTIHRKAFDYLVEILAQHHFPNQSDRNQFKTRIENNTEAFGQILRDIGVFEKKDSTNLTQLKKTEDGDFEKWKSFFCNFEGLIANCENDTIRSIEISSMAFFEQMEEDDCFNDVTCYTEMQYLSALHHVLLISNYTYYGLFYDIKRNDILASFDQEIKCLNMFTDNAMLAEIAAVAYMKQYLGRDLFLLMDRILSNVRSAALEMLNSVKDEKTRESLQTYLQEIQAQNYEDLLDCDTLREKFNLPKLSKNKRTVFSPYVLRWWNLQRILQENYDTSGPLQKGKMFVMANAFYSPEENLIEILPFLINNFYDKTNPLSLQYAFLGDVMGHEFFHSLDPNVIKYNYIGDDTRVWDGDTNATYLEFKNCIIDVFDQSGINGIQTVGEIFSDVMGTKAAFKALTSFEDSAHVSNSLRKNPGFQQFTPEQLFFIGIGQQWCEASVNEAKTSKYYFSHPPHWSRVNVALSINSNFGKAFKCGKESKMTSANHCNLW